MNATQSHIALTSDSGEVNVLEISSGDVREMRIKHSSVGAPRPRRYSPLIFVP